MPCGGKKKYSFFIYLGFPGWHSSSPNSSFSSFAPESQTYKISREENQNQYDFHLPPALLPAPSLQLLCKVILLYIRFT